MESNNDVSNSLSKPLKKYDDHFVPFNDASLSKHSTNILVQAPRSKAEIQKELLGLKRKALANATPEQKRTVRPVSGFNFNTFGFSTH